MMPLETYSDGKKGNVSMKKYLALVMNGYECQGVEARKQLPKLIIDFNLRDNSKIRD
jgi:hypothetical protein